MASKREKTREEMALKSEDLQGFIDEFQRESEEARSTLNRYVREFCTPDLTAAPEGSSDTEA